MEKLKNGILGGLIVVGGLAHVAPSMLAPLTSWGFGGITVQLVAGVVLVLIGIGYFGVKVIKGI